MEEKTKIKITISMLKGILSWSDRIGSDEIYEIQEIIKLLTKTK
mgnify:CR=1 FL=1|tara:strand:- start:267 stop:398 length:132 start_codon:yes stop_codon:yes gene_type:complete